MKRSARWTTNLNPHEFENSNIPAAGCSGSFAFQRSNILRCKAQALIELSCQACVTRILLSRPGPKPNAKSYASFSPPTLPVTLKYSLGIKKLRKKVQSQLGFLQSAMQRARTDAPRQEVGLKAVAKFSLGIQNLCGNLAHKISRSCG